MANTKKAALITGANKGLGFEMARQLGQAEVIVVLAARDPQKAKPRLRNSAVRGWTCNSSSSTSPNKPTARRLRPFSTRSFGRLDILINNISAEVLGTGKVSATNRRHDSPHV